MRRRRYLKQCAKDIIFSASGSGLFDNLFSVLILAAVSAGLVQTGYIFIALFEPYVSDAGHSFHGTLVLCRVSRVLRLHEEDDICFRRE